MRSMVGRRLSPLASLISFALVTTVSAFFVLASAQQAAANHGDRTLDSPNELVGAAGSGSDGPFTGDPVSIIVNLSAAPDAGQTISIDIEHTAGANDPDKSNTPGTPDASCDIAAPASQCVYTYTGLNANGSTSPDRIMFWIDHDKFQSTVEADTGEGRRASQADCEQEDPTTTNPTGCPPVHSSYSPGTGGTSCDAVTLPTDEPDCTDVVEVDYDNRTSIANSIDCDDAGTPDTERETNPATTTTSSGSETYRCQVRDQFGSGLNGIRVNGEVIDIVNDPDTPDSESFASPDYGCTATDFDPEDPIFGEAGICDITVTQNENELGTTRICWWAGEPSAGESLCGIQLSQEPINDNQQADGSDTGNDLADSVELTWESASTFVINCDPEQDTNPTGTTHTITCTANSSTTQRAVSGVSIQGEVVGAGDADMGDSPQTPDKSCTTGANGSCNITHSSSSTGTSTFRIWINDGVPEPRVPSGLDEDIDATEGRDETAAAGEKAEPDSTDVVEKMWTQAPTSVVMEPEADNAEVGDCNPYTLTATSGAGPTSQPVANVVLDIEQIHEKFTDSTANNEPTVSFCQPSSGPNPSQVDTSKGDLGPGSTNATDIETPDNPGTAGGETSTGTDVNGQVTIGIRVAAGQGSTGEGQVNLTGFFDVNDNDDPDTSEPKDTATKSWATQAGQGGRVINCEPETATTSTEDTHTVTCTVTDASNQPEQGQSVTFSETGPGDLTGSSQVVTNAQGQASVTVASDDGGEQEITGTLTNSTQGEPDTDECNRAANDPVGAPAGVCSDTVTNEWEDTNPQCDDGEDNDGDGRTDHPDDPGCSDADDDTEAGEPQCEDGIDNDGDGDTDFPSDDGCTSESDNDEADEVEPACPGYEGDPRNQIVGTEGDDVITGTPGDDIICGLGGDDSIDGLAGNDLILGGSGNDDLGGGSGRDDIRGGAGNDVLTGGSGKDILRGGGGKDKLRGGGGKDKLRGGKGKDSYNGGGGNDNCDDHKKEKAKSC